MRLIKFSFTARLIALVTFLSLAATLISSSCLIWLNYQTTIKVVKNQGENISRLLAKSARLAEAFPDEVEDIISQHMIVSAQILAGYVDMAEKAGLRTDEINRRLTAITDKTVLDDFGASDESGHTYIHKTGVPDFTFSPSAQKQPFAHEFWQLLNGTTDIVNQKVHKREIDNEWFKYVGVRGADKQRIVLVGYSADYINSIKRQLGIQRTIDNLVGSEDIEAIYIFDKKMNIIAGPQSNQQWAGERGLAAEELGLVRVSIENGNLSLIPGRNAISFISPIQNDAGEFIGSALIRTSTAHIKDLINSQLKISAGVAALTVLLGTFMANFLARRQAAPILEITNAAHNVEARQFSSQDLDNVANRSDEVGQLARVFRQLSLDFLNREMTLDTLVKEKTAELMERNSQLEKLSVRLSKYLSPQIYSSLFHEDRSTSIPTKRKKLTVFFSDIVNFSDITERVESEDITRILNEYLNEMSSIALKYGATIDKYVGDAIMIFFGDPETLGVQEDARACVVMALEMQRTIKHLAMRWQKQGFDHPFQIRIGINTGYCTVGDFGSNERMDYTIIGHQVNIAARLEQSALPGTILISHDTYVFVKDLVDVEEREPLSVKGISRTIQAFTILKLKEIPQQSFIQVEAKGINYEIDLNVADRNELRKLLQSTLDKISPSD